MPTRPRRPPTSSITTTRSRISRGRAFVPAAFVGGALNCDVARDLPFVEAPVLLLWGKRAKNINPARHAKEYAELSRHAEIELFVNSALLPHEEEPDAVAARIETFLADRPA